MELNSYQQAAVYDESPACLVNACVGSGKTTVLTAKIAWLHEVKKVPFEKMAVMTFTNRAAGEIMERIGAKEAPPAYFGTFHSVCMSLLKNELPLEQTGYTKEFEILDPDAEMELAEEMIRDKKLKVKYKNRLKKRLETERKAFESGQELKYGDELFVLFRLLDEWKKRENRMTFKDLIDIAADLLAIHPVDLDWVLVDEIQDCNAKQAELLKVMCGPNTRFFGVGDPNQMIYGFRGSEETVYYRIKQQFHAKELSLPVNYRSTASILSVANSFRQYGTAISGTIPDEEKIPVNEYYDSFLEAEVLGERILERHRKDGLPFSEMAILYRTQEQSVPFEKAFERMGIPFRTSGTETEKREENAVRLLTAHASKGLEFSDVYVVGLNMGLFPIRTKTMEDQMEEQRLFFVAITRARKRLELSYYTNPTRPDVYPGSGIFLKRIPESLLLREKERTQKEKNDHLKELRREVAKGIREKEEPLPVEKVKERIKYAVHPKYGKGVICREDESVWEVEFEGFGKKEFLKLFSELTIEE